MASHPERKHQQNRLAKCPLIGCGRRMRRIGLINHIVDKHPEELKKLDREKALA